MRTIFVVHYKKISDQADERDKQGKRNTVLLIDKTNNNNNNSKKLKIENGEEDWILFEEEILDDGAEGERLLIDLSIHLSISVRCFSNWHTILTLILPSDSVTKSTTSNKYTATISKLDQVESKPFQYFHQYLNNIILSPLTFINLFLPLDRVPVIVLD